MNIVTKIFIVLTLVCSIMLSVLVVFTLGNVRPLKDALTDAQGGMRMASMALAAAEAKANDMQVQADKQVETYKSQVNDLKKQVADLNTSLTTLNAAKAKIEADFTVTNNTVARLTATTGQMQTTNAQLTTELNEARPKLALLAKELAEVNMANEVATTKLEQASRAIDRLKEQLVQASKPASSASTDSVGGVTTLTAGMATAAPINGKVVDVRNDNGKIYLALSLGERDNIQVGTRFTISRGDKYVGDAIVERVAPDQSVAVVRGGNPLPVQVNDLVSSGQ